MSRKILLSANEAVAWGACKAGCSVASAYPGTPSTEIMENMRKFKDTVNCEWAVNEKCAMEVVVGASIAGARALTARPRKRPRMRPSSPIRLRGSKVMPS